MTSAAASRDTTMRSGRGRPRALAAAGLLTLAYTSTVIVLGLSCRDFLVRPDNQVAIAVASLAGGAMLWAGMSSNVYSTRLYLGLFSAGAVAGLHFQPSTAMLLAGAVALLSLVTLAGRGRSLLGAALFAGGSIVGYLLMLGLMTVVVPGRFVC